MNSYSPGRSYRFAAIAITRTSLIVTSLLLAACTTPQSTDQSKKSFLPVPPAELPAVPSQDELALRAIVLHQSRLYRVASPLFVNNAQLCKSHARYLLGFVARNRYSYTSAYQTAAQKALRLSDRLQVMDIIGGGGAAKAGLLPGDVLLSVEDKPFAEGENAERETAAMLAPLVAGRSAIRLQVQRNGREMLLHVPLTHSCAFVMESGNSDAIVTLSDGYRILVSRGMMQFAVSDDELAYVVAKEIAHNILSHRSGRDVGTVGALIDNLTRVHPDLNMPFYVSGLAPMSQKTEVQADRLALYLLARAGYNLDAVVPFVRKFAADQHPASRLAYAAMHPATSFRIAAIESTMKEIRAKQYRGVALHP